MTLAARLSALATRVATEIKVALARIVALEDRTEVVMLSESDYAALDPKDPDVFYATFPDPP
jgi:hypothetical protein